jgi:molybdenum cofactor guanylyltransferase
LSKEEKRLVSGLVLAGGRARRFGGMDKGLMPLRGRPMITHVLERFAPQVDEVLINANRNLETYRSFGPRVIEDELQGFAGPLAGIQSGLAASGHPLLATVPCDSPWLPGDLVARLLGALSTNQADAAVAKLGARRQPVFALYRRSVLAALKRYLAGDGRKVDGWLATLNVIEVPFDDEAEAFANINTPEDLARTQGSA